MEDQEAGEEEGEEAALRYWMELRMRVEEAAVGEAQQELRHGLVEGEAEGDLGWEGVVERTCQVGMEEEEARRREPWRGEEVVGHRVHEEAEEGLSCGVVVGVGEEGRLWMEGVEELERKNKQT